MPDTATTGSISRAKAVLDALVGAPNGATLSEVIASTDFNKTTAHRVLQSLQAVRYVAQDPESRRYRLGTALARLARQANASDISALTARSMRRLADFSEDTVFLSVPEGALSICVAVVTGAFPIRTLSLEVGDRLPLGVGATGQALFASMTPARRHAITSANGNWMTDYNITPELAEELAMDFAERGYALNPSLVVPGMSAVARPIITTQGRLVCSIGIGAINDRMSAARIEDILVPALRREEALLVKRFSELQEEGLL